MRRKNFILKVSFGFLPILLPLLLSIVFVSCQDDDLTRNEEPKWLGSSIYGYLKNEKNYTTYLKLVDEVGYADVLSKTGSKTVFVADDDAFNRFFEDNPWGVTSYESLSLAQKKLIMNFGMIDNAYLLSSLSNYNFGGSLVEGTAFRRASASSQFDTIPFLKGDKLPVSKYWDMYRSSGINLITDDFTNKFVLYFLDRPLRNADISNQDFSIITGKERTDGDVHLFDIPVISGDIICKNGYIHILEDVMIPPYNMGDYLQMDSETQIFSSLLERFSAPYYDGDINQEFKLVNPDFTDSIFVKGYFSPDYIQYPDESLVPTDTRLLFSPGSNSYSSADQADMSTMLVPTDNAMSEYLDSGAGMILKERFGDWDGVPDHIVTKFLNRHMRTSFIESVPSRFDKLMDASNDPVPVSHSHIESSYLASNGLIYKTNEVYPPNDYISVYAPVLFGANTRIFDWVINKLDYTFYLNSMVSRYSFFVPTDEFFENYIDPITWGENRNVPAALKFKYDTERSEVRAVVHSYDPATEIVGDSIGSVRYSGSNNEYYDFIVNRLWDLLESHLVVGDVESGSKYVLTNGGTLLKVEGNGTSMKLQGGGDIDRNVEINVTDVYQQANGNTYFIDAPIQGPLKSLYSVLKSTPEFSEFFTLLANFPERNKQVFFVRANGYFGVDFNIKFLNTYNYTVYVPTNQAIVDAINDGIILPWESSPKFPQVTHGINDLLTIANDDEANPDDKLAAQKEADKAIEQLALFLRYHFQDNSVLISGESAAPHIYQTATIKTDSIESHFGTYINKYYKLQVTVDNDKINIHTEADETASVKTDGGLYNIITRDYIFGRNSTSYKEADGTGSGTHAYSSSIIETSSTAVIHQVDKVLMYKKRD